MINKIYIDPEYYSEFKIQDSEPNWLPNVNRINIFIGPNNSGKSRFLRRMFNEEKIKFRDSDDTFNELNSLVQEFYVYITNQFDTWGIKDAYGLITKLNSFENKYISNESDYYERFEDLFLNGLKVNGKISAEMKSPNTSLSERAPKIISEFISSKLNMINNSIKLFKKNRTQFNYSNIYIPILRGLRNIQDVEDKNNSGNSDLYLKRTLHDYFPDKAALTDFVGKLFTGQRFYNVLKSHRDGDDDEQENLKEFEKFLKENFFNGSDVQLISHKSGRTRIKVGNETQRNIFDVGDGVQNIIIILYYMFMNQGKEMLFFIEEPEINLHPGYQRLLIDTLMKFKNFQFFITTHSNHLLDISLDYENISVYTFQKKETSNPEKPEFNITNVKNDDPDILDLIEVRNASVFLSNCTIWVEGITDRLYIRKYLDVYQAGLVEKGKIKEKYKEDLHYSFVEYSGANLDHWDFDTNGESEKPIAKRLSNKIFLVADGDALDEAKKSKKAERYNMIKEKLGEEKVAILESREIENLLAPEIILLTLRDLEKNLEIEFKSNKITIDKYKSKYLGKFIDENVINLKKTYSAQSGTIKNKVKFCNSAIQHITKFEDLSEEAKALTDRIFKFIQKNNPS